MKRRITKNMFFFFQAEDGIRDLTVTGVQTCALPILNNATYFTYFEQTRILWLRSAEMNAVRPKHEGIVVAQASCRYLAPIPYPETLRIPMFIGKLGRSSIPTYYEIHGTEARVKYAEGEVVLVWIDRRTGKSLPIPEQVRTLLS